MALKRHHKIILGGFSAIIIAFMITNSIVIYSILAKQDSNYKTLNQKIIELQTDTQSKINELSNGLIQTKEAVSGLNQSLKSEISLLKAYSEDFSGIIDGVVKSVVTIRTNVGQGTGFIITDDGYIVTNAHVLVGGRKVEAITYDQMIFNANFIGYDGDFDIALLKIPGDYGGLNFENSNNIQVGEKVIAIGNPLGLQFSVSEGIVSAIHRTGLNELEVYIQTDAALNPGNSGGPLINKRGKVIGINNFKVGGGESLGFALESNYIKKAVNDIAEQTLNQTLL